MKNVTKFRRFFWNLEGTLEPDFCPCRPFSLPASLQPCICDLPLFSWHLLSFLSWSFSEPSSFHDFHLTSPIPPSCLDFSLHLLTSSMKEFCLPSPSVSFLASLCKCNIFPGFPGFSPSFLDYASFSLPLTVCSDFSILASWFYFVLSPLCLASAWVSWILRCFLASIYGSRLLFDLFLLDWIWISFSLFLFVLSVFQFWARLQFWEQCELKLIKWVLCIVKYLT